VIDKLNSSSFAMSQFYWNKSFISGVLFILDCKLPFLWSHKGCAWTSKWPNILR